MILPVVSTKRWSKCASCRSFPERAHEASAVHAPRVVAVDCSGRTDGCRRLHHPLLHNQDGNSQTPPPETVGHMSQKQNLKQILLKVIPVTVRGPKGEISTHALLDEGSTVTLVDSKLADQVGADGKEEPLNRRWMNDDGHQSCKSKRISLEIFGANGEIHKMVDVRTVTGLDLPAQSVKMEHVRKNESS